MTSFYIQEYYKPCRVKNIHLIPLLTPASVSPPSLILELHNKSFANLNKQSKSIPITWKFLISIWPPKRKFHIPPLNSLKSPFPTAGMLTSLTTSNPLKMSSLQSMVLRAIIDNGQVWRRKWEQLAGGSTSLYLGSTMKTKEEGIILGAWMTFHNFWFFCSIN